MIEAKDDNASSSSRLVGAERLQQGTPEYAREGISEVADRSLRERLKMAVEASQLGYVTTRQPVRDGELGELSAREHNMDEGE